MRLSTLLTLSLFTLFFSLAPTAGRALELVNAGLNGQPEGWAMYPAISSDGKWVAYEQCGDLAAEDLNRACDIYVSDLDTGNFELTSVTSDGRGANNFSSYPAISADGRFVAFVSNASNLVPGDTNNIMDLFLRDRVAGTTEIINIGTDGQQATSPQIDHYAELSADGRYVVFYSSSQLTPTGTTGIYLRDRLTQTTTFINRGTHPAISGDGRIVAYYDGINLRLFDQQTGTTEVITANLYDARNWNNPYAFIPSLSADGRYVAYAGWSADNAPLSTEVFVFDRVEKSTRQITKAFDGSPLTSAACDYNSELKPQISADGRQVVFASCAADIVAGVDGIQLYRQELVTGQTVRLPIDNLWSLVYFPIFSTSGDGGIVVFQDTNSNHLASSSNALGIFSTRTGVDSPSDDAGSDDNPGNGDGGVPPEVGSLTIAATPDVLWPPNSKMTDVLVSVGGAEGADVKIQLVDEYGNLDQVLYGREVSIPLEAWRKGGDKDGRTYTLTATTVDSASGLPRSTSVVVSVPHDMR